MANTNNTMINLSLTPDEANNQILQNEQMIETLKGEATGCGDFQRILEIVHVVEPLEAVMNKMKTAMMTAMMGTTGGVTVVKPE